MISADLQAFCASHNIAVQYIDGEPYFDETAMRQLADLAPAPVSAHSALDQMLAAARDEFA